MNGCCGWLFHQFLPEGISYERAKLRVQTFDLVYFCQLENWTGPFVAFFSGKMCTHMGVLIRGRPDVRGNAELYVLESIRHADNAGDISRSGQIHTGVRVVSLSEKLQHPEERYYVYVQPVLMDKATRRAAEAKLWPFIYEHNTTPFEEHFSTFLLAPLNRPWGHGEEDTSSLFCSELVALTLRTCGLLDVDNVSR